MIPKYRDIVDLIKKGSTIEAQEQIMALREAALELQEENQTLKDKIRELESKLSIEGQLVYEKPSYWLIQGDSKDGPFCQKCKDTDDQLVRLQGGKNDFWSCRACSSRFKGPKYQPPKPASRRPSSWMSV